MLRERYRCTWLLVDAWMLRDLLASRRLAGLADSAPLPPGSAAETFLAREADLAPPPGWSCVWMNRAARGEAEESTFALWQYQPGDPDRRHSHDRDVVDGGPAALRGLAWPPPPGS